MTGDLPRSLAEIRAMVTKAARGAGCAWGVAGDAGWAVRHLESVDLPGVTSIAALFDQDRCCACSGGGPRCGIAQMLALSDLPPDEGRDLGPVVAPLLLAAPFLTASQGLTVRWAAGSLTCGGGRASLIGQLPGVVEEASVAPASAPSEGSVPDWRGRQVPEAAWLRLEELAARTLVPESEQSRAAGAGPDS